MCFHSKQTKKAIELEHRFRAKFENEAAYTPSIFNGFTFPKTPVISNQSPHKIEMMNWGLLPAWAKDMDFRKNTLNARLETIHEKPSFKNVTQQKCLVLIDGFFEWQWLDPKGLKKQKYLIEKPNSEAFALAGLWSEWTDRNTGEVLRTYTILTTEANALMSEIHNSKKRMPVILDQTQEDKWLDGKPFEFTDPDIIASAV